MKTEDAQALAEMWMEHHGLRDWRFKFDNARTRFGACYWRKRVISISAAMTEMNDEAAVEDVILHEIAHAIAGHEAGHGIRWKAVAEHIGARPERCYSAARVHAPPPRWLGTCPSCSETFYRHRRRKISCGHCSERYDERHLLEWEEWT